MAGSKWQTWAVEKRIYSLLSADSTLWGNINGQLYEGAIPKGVATRAPSLFVLVRDVSRQDHYDVIHDLNTITDRSQVAWNVYDYEVVLTGETDSYGEVLYSNADRVYTDLHNTQGTVDGNQINLLVIGTVKSRVVRDGRTIKELGHKVRALVTDDANPRVLSNRAYFLFGNPGAEVDLAAFASTIHWDRKIDSSGTEHSIFTLEGYVSEGGNTLTNFMVDLNTKNKNYIYGPFGNAAGKRKVTTGGLNTASMVEFELLHGIEVSSGAALGPAEPLRWRAVIDSPVSAFLVFP